MKTNVYCMAAPESAAYLEQAAQVIRAGGLVAFPTETVYGLGADGLNGAAVAGIFRAKGRPQDNPLILHIADLAMLPDITRQPGEAAYRLAAQFWPGPLTLVLPRQPVVPDEVSAGLDTVAVRFPSHLTAQALIRAAGVPIAAPSANRSGSPSPTTAAHCLHDLDGRVEIILDAGSCGVGVESTVLSLTGPVPRILRPGGVTLEMLRRVLGQVAVDPAVLSPLEEGRPAASPGMKYKHYAPAGRLTLVEGTAADFAAYVNQRAGQGVFALAFTEDLPLLAVPAVGYGAAGDAEAQARAVFAALRRLDELGAQRIYGHCPAREGVGLAVCNRLLRAAAFDVVHL